jgi:adenylate kinase
MRLVLLGPPGSGKGTQAVRIAQNFKLPHISTGDILRDNVSRNTELGKKAKSFMDKGLLVPDELVVEMTKQRLAQKDCQKDWILDGFPRTVPQAEALDKFAPPEVVLNLFIESAELIKRSAGRRICTKCKAVYNIHSNPPKAEDVCDKCGGDLMQRVDDKEDVVRHRIEVYEEQTRPLVKFYTQKGILRSAYSAGTIDQVFERILEALKHSP